MSLLDRVAGELPDQEEPENPDDPSCPICDQYFRHACKLVRREGQPTRLVFGHHCPDCGGVVWDDGPSGCVCDGEGVHWEP